MSSPNALRAEIMGIAAQRGIGEGERACATRSTGLEERWAVAKNFTSRSKNGPWARKPGDKRLAQVCMDPVISGEQNCSRAGWGEPRKDGRERKPSPYGGSVGRNKRVLELRWSEKAC